MSSRWPTASARWYAFDEIPLISLAIARPVVIAARLAPLSWPRAMAELPATAIGSLGVFWCLERSLGCLVGGAA